MSPQDVPIAVDEPAVLSDLEPGSNDGPQAPSESSVTSKPVTNTCPSPGEPAEPDGESLPDRSSLIAQAALDLVAQHYGSQAADRVARIMQSLATAHAEDESSRVGKLEEGVQFLAYSAPVPNPNQAPMRVVCTSSSTAPGAQLGETFKSAISSNGPLPAFNAEAQMGNSRAIASTAAPTPNRAPSSDHFANPASTQENRPNSSSIPSSFGELGSQMDELFLSDTEVIANTSSTNIASKKGRQTEDAPANPTTEAQSARAVHSADVATQTLDNSEDAEYRKLIQAETTGW
ncbi:hypothetical protein ACG7TL_003222 [Trametes sanguinea]